MRRHFLILVLILIFSGHLRSQNYNWITPNKQYLKMFVAEDGMYRLFKTDFAGAGVNTTGIDPRTVKIYNKGVQLPVFFHGESDGSFDVADYIDFYATRNYGGPTKTYNEANVLQYTTDEWFNQYSDTNVYWIDWGGANGLRMQVSSHIAPTFYNDQFYMDKVHLEKDKIYWIGEFKDGNDFRDFTNERFLGESWYWSFLASNQSVSDTFSTPHLYTVPQTASVRIFAYPQNISTTINNEHTLTIKINNNTVTTITKNDYRKFDTTVTFSSSLLSNIGVNTVSATYTANGGFEGYMFYDMFEIQYPKLFKFRDSQTMISAGGPDTASARFRVSSFNGANPVNIYDVTNNIKINGYSSIADTLFFTGKRNSKFEVINKNITKKPFRITSRQVPDYVSSSNGVDYLLLYNSLFESQASQLKTYRETKDNFRVTKVEIGYIYDIFNYGLEDPIAVRNFTRHVYANWQLPRLKYLCLFGRGSLDPKKNSPTTVYEKNLIPLYGNPSSDNYYANVNANGFTYYTHFAIGRLCAYTPAEAQAMVDNIILYESQPPADWVKNNTFITGGVNASEQALFLPINNDTLINPFITPKPLGNNPVRIYRNDLNGVLTYNFSDSIKNQINRGTLTVNFMGHAGSQDWELGMTDPNVLSTMNGRFPLIFSMTCYTGKTGEPLFRSFGEKFMTMPNKGAIGYVGTTGWGFIYTQLGLNRWMYYSMAKDSVRRIGDLFSYAMNRIKVDSTVFSVRHTVNCYTLHGDPALKLALPTYPEYSVSSEDYKLSNNSPSVNEQAVLTVYPKNYGVFSDSMRVKIQISTILKKYQTKDTVIRNFKYSDSIKCSFKLNEAGTYYFTVTLDPANQNTRENKLNNELSFTVTTKNFGFMALRPVDNAVISTDSIQFVGLNPYLNRNNASLKVLLEFDTTKNFNSPLKQTFINSSLTGVTTKFKAAVPRLDTNVLYYWRTNSIINSDTSGWSKYRTFRYYPSMAAAGDSTVVTYKNKNNQFIETDYINTNFSSTGIKLNDFNMNLYVRSMGSNGAEASYFSLGNKSIHIDAGGNTGLNLLKVRKLDGGIVQFKNFKMTFPNSSDSILNFLNTFDSTHYLMGLNASYVGGTYLMNPNLITKFNQFGSTQIHRIRVGWFDTWSFIGFLNATQAEVSEDFDVFNSLAWVPSISSMDKQFKQKDGTVSWLVGPSNDWDNFSWKQTLLPVNSIKFDVYGIDKNNAQTLLFSEVSTNNLVDLNNLNAYQYPYLNLVSKLRVDTITGLISPLLHSIKTQFTQPSEIVPDLSTYWQSDSAIDVGDELKFKIRCHNAGSITVPGIIVNVYKTSSAMPNLIKSDTLYTQLSTDNSALVTGKFYVPYLRMNENNKATFVAELLPLGQNNETYTFNDYFFMPVYINPVHSAPSVQVFSDGQLVNSGDYVAKNPELKIMLSSVQSDDKLLQHDTGTIMLKLNGSRISLFNQDASNMVAERSGSNKRSESVTVVNTDNSIIYKPALNSGENKLQIVYRTADGMLDSADYSLFVSDELLVKDFYNYPNPMLNETSFMFNLLGSEIPFNCKIRIYTIAGRLIREIDFAPVIGYNQIQWDGRDNDGDILANGTYLYKLIAEDDAKKETAIQKLVILR